MREDRVRNARGAVLLEAVIALAILASVGGTAAWMASESIRSVGHVHEEENRVRAAARLLTAVSLWPRQDLDRHLGNTSQGSWRLLVDRVGPTLYAVAIVDSATGKVTLRSSLFRREVEP
jgi:type II secretory pathway component PulJ